MPNKYHKNQKLENNHSITAANYADIAERDADVGFQTFENIDTVVKVRTSPVTFYLLVGAFPSTDWEEITGSEFNTFLKLTDTFESSYTGKAGSATIVNDAETGLIFGPDVRTTSDVTFNSLILTGDLDIQGSVTTINTTSLEVKDENIEIGKVASPTDTTADGGGITLKGTTDKTITWLNSIKAWVFNQIAIFTDTVTIGSSAAPPTDVSLDLTDSTKGFRPNRGTTTQRLALTTYEGLEFFDTDLKIKYLYQGVMWVSLQVGGGDVTSSSLAADNQLYRSDGTSGKVIQSAPDTYIDDSGNLGLGVSTPEEKLQIEGNIILGSTDGTRYLYYDNGTANNPGIRYNDSIDKLEFSNDGMIWREFSNSIGVELHAIDQGANITLLIQNQVQRIAATFTEGEAERFSTTSTGNAEYTGLEDITLQAITNNTGTVSTGTNIPVNFYIAKNDSGLLIASMADAGGGLVEATCNQAHGYTTGDRIIQENTTTYNDEYTITVTGSTTYTFIETFIATSTGFPSKVIMKTKSSNDFSGANKNTTLISLIPVVTGDILFLCVENVGNSANWLTEEIHLILTKV